jgi:hypothetical protein
MAIAVKLVTIVLLVAIICHIENNRLISAINGIAGNLYRLLLLCRRGVKKE